MSTLNELSSAAITNNKIVVCLSRKVGFFALFFQILGHIYQADKEGAIPVVFFGSNCLYWSKDGYDGRQGNAWEYYFEPVTSLRIEHIFNEPIERLRHASIFEYSKADITHNPPEEYTGDTRGSILVPDNVKVTNCWAEFDPGQQEIHEERRSIFRSLIDRYIRITPNIEAKIERFYQHEFVGKKLIGVHMRGTERSVEVTGWYGKPHLDEQTYMREVDMALKKFPDAQIFLATDTQNTVDIFKARYKERLLTYDAQRSDEGNSPHLQFGGAVLGEQVLIESIMLSRTDFLIHGISNVAFAALCFNPELSHLNVYSKYGKAMEMKTKTDGQFRSFTQKIKRHVKTLLNK
ncbi:MAG: nodulation protein NodZ [Cyanobacteria bacterium P01_C01_bin.120]